MMGVPSLLFLRSANSLSDQVIYMPPNDLTLCSGQTLQAPKYYQRIILQPMQIWIVLVALLVSDNLG
jgi:hypothetical protein